MQALSRSAVEDSCSSTVMARPMSCCMASSRMSREACVRVGRSGLEMRRSVDIGALVTADTEAGSRPRTFGAVSKLKHDPDLTVCIHDKRLGTVQYEDIADCVTICTV